MQLPNILANLANESYKSILLIGPCHLDLLDMATTLASFYHCLPIFLSPTQYDLTAYKTTQVFITETPIPADQLQNHINIIVSYKSLVDPVINVTIRFCTHPVYTWATEVKIHKPSIGGQNIVIIPDFFGV